MKKESMKNKTVIILGAGLTGLSAAYKLSQSGMDVVLLEKEEEIGGLSRTLHHRNARFDMGIHGFFPSEAGNEAYLEFIDEHIGTSLVTINKETSIYFNNNYVKYPLGFKDMFFSLNPITSFLCFLDFLRHRIKLKFKKGEDDRSFMGWICNRFGGKLYNIYFGPFAKKTWGVPPDELASIVLGRRVTVVSIWDVIKKGFLKAFGLQKIIDKEYPQQPVNYLYAREGVEKLPNVLGEKVRQMGGKIITGCTIKSLEKQENGFVCEIEDAENGSEFLNSDVLISTIPVTTLVPLFNPDHEVVQASQRLKYRSLIIVNLTVSKEKIFNDQWVYFSSDATVFTRINEFSNVYETFAEKGYSSICVEVPCFEEDPIYETSDREILDQVVSEIETLELFNRGDIDEFSIVRIPHAYPIYTVDSNAYLDKLEKFMAQTKGVFSIGRQGGFSYINMDEAIKDGFGAAESILGGNYE